MPSAARPERTRSDTALHATDLATEAPTWVYLLLVGLIALGVRRLKTREVPVVVALLPAIAFLAWSVVGADAFASRAGSGTALACWLAGAAVGVASVHVVAEPRGTILPGGRVRLPGTWLPLVLYLGVFVARFFCGAWATIRPAEAITATGTATVIGAAMTTRLVVAVKRWRLLVSTTPMG